MSTGSRLDGAQQKGIEPPVHHAPSGFSERFALAFTRLLRWCADTFFAKHYGHRAIVLETVAAVPGRVGAACRARSARGVISRRRRNHPT